MMYFLEYAPLMSCSCFHALVIIIYTLELLVNKPWQLKWLYAIINEFDTTEITSTKYSAF